MTGLSFQDYLPNEELQLAVERRLEIIGEAARRISDAFRAEHPAIPWRSIIGQRNILIHEYNDIDHRRVWRTATEEIPWLIEQLESLLPPEPPDAGQ